MPENPIIFIHYGDNDYLKYVFMSAKKHNDRVILIGDKSNVKYKSLGIEHYSFNDFLFGEKLDRFNNVYKRIGGEEFERINESKGGTDWTKFNFKKWFVLENFCLERGIDALWTFDSDNLVLRNLKTQESKFSEYDSTEQNFGMSMQGLINRVGMLSDFTEKIIELFTREDYLDEQRRDFEKKTEYGFTMMRAYKTFREEEGKYSTIRLNTIIGGETFLDFLFWKEDMRLHRDRILGREIKQLYYDSSGRLYVFSELGNAYLRVNSIDLSWLPTFFYKRVYDISINQKNLPANGYRKVNYSKPLEYILRANFYALRKKIGMVK